MNLLFQAYLTEQRFPVKGELAPHGASGSVGRHLVVTMTGEKTVLCIQCTGQLTTKHDSVPANSANVITEKKTKAQKSKN